MTAGRFIQGLANGLAVLGGIALGAIIAVTVISVSGRALLRFGLGPIPGDYEICQAITGFATFCFLPYCQLNRGHVIIDLLTRTMGPVLVRIVDALAEIVMALVLAVIAWRLTDGFLDKYHNGETSFILQFPIWWGYGACLPPSYAAVLTAIYMSGRAIRSVVIGRDLLPEHHGME